MSECFCSAPVQEEGDENTDYEIETSVIFTPKPEEKEKKTTKKEDDEIISERDFAVYYRPFWHAIDIVRHDPSKTEELKKLKIVKKGKHKGVLRAIKTGENAYDVYRFFTTQRVKRVDELNQIVETIAKLNEEIKTAHADISDIRKEAKSKISSIKLTIKSKTTELERLRRLQKLKSIDECADDGDKLFVDHFALKDK